MQSTTIKSREAVKWETKTGKFSSTVGALVKGYKLQQFILQHKFDRALFIEKAQFGSIQCHLRLETDEETGN